MSTFEIVDIEKKIVEVDGRRVPLVIVVIPSEISISYAFHCTFENGWIMATTSSRLQWDGEDEIKSSFDTAAIAGWSANGMNSITNGIQGIVRTHMLPDKNFFGSPVHPDEWWVWWETFSRMPSRSKGE